jgi:hypothetical protein
MTLWSPLCPLFQMLVACHSATAVVIPPHTVARLSGHLDALRMGSVLALLRIVWGNGLDGVN